MPSKTYFALLAITMLAVSLVVIIYQFELIPVNSMPVVLIGSERSNSNMSGLVDTGQESGELRVASARQWIINNRVAQYSARIIVKDKGRLVLESLIFYDHVNQTSETLRQNLNFVILFGDGERLLMRVDEAFGCVTNLWRANSNRYLWKVKTELEIDVALVNFETTVFLLTDLGEHQRMLMSWPNYSPKLLTYQKPTIYNFTQKKKPAIGHCVHMVRNLNSAKLAQMKQWLTMQQRIGIDTVRLYFSRVDKPAQDDINKFISTNSGKMTIEIVEFGSPHYEVTCEPQIALAKAFPTSQVASYIHIACREFFFTHLGDHWPGFHAQELVATNDCLASFKFSHEFVTNYDFDELILPHNFVPTQNLSYAVNLTCDTKLELDKPKPSDYNLYNYVRKLINKATNGTNKKVISALHFKHMLMFDELPKGFVADLFNSSLLNKSRRVTFDYNKMQFYFNVAPGPDAALRNAIKIHGPLAKCLAEIANSTNIDPKWIRVHGIWLDVRQGKSVFNTDVTDFINQHSIQSSTDPQAQSFDVPLDFGFVLHFRGEIDAQFFLGQIYSFNEHYRLDLEYSYFLASLFQGSIQL